MHTTYSLRSFFTGAMVAGAVAAVAMPASAQQAIRLGTSSIGSTFYVIAIGMSKLIHSHAGVNVTVEPLGGSHANMFGLARDRVDFAIANSGAAFDRYHGNRPFKKKYEVRLVAQGQPTLRWPVSRKGAGIDSPEDWVGKTLQGKRRPLPQLEKIANAIIRIYGLPEEEIDLVSSVNLGEVNRTLRAGSVDGAVMPFSLSQPVTSKLFQDGIIEPLILPEDRYDAVKAALPDVFYKMRVPANNFENQPEPFLVLAMNTLLTTGADAPEEMVYKVTKAIMGHSEEFSTYHASARYWTSKRTMKEPKLPFHSGAVRFYKEAGVWTAEMDKIQKRLLNEK